MDGSAGVVVDNGLIAEVDDVHSPIWASHHLDGTEPQVSAGDEFLLLATVLLGGLKGYAILDDIEVSDNIEGGFAGEIAEFPFLRPGTAFINNGPCSSGVASDLIDLHVGLLFPLHGGESASAGEEAVGATDSGQFPFG